MTEEEIKEKNEKTKKHVDIFLGILKLAVVYSLTCTLFWASWNLFFWEELGIGKECSGWWKFGLPTLGLFAILRGLNPVWYKLLNFADIFVYSLFIGVMLGLLWLF